MSNVGRFARSIAHTRPRQLMERAAKIGRQALHDRLGAWWRAGAIERSTPRIADVAPQPLLAPRTHLVADASEPTARVLATTHTLHGPIDWHPRDWNELLWMNLHYMEFLEALEDAEFVRVVRDWIASNSWRARGSWRVAWNSYVVSLRVVVWMQQLAVRRERLPSDVFDEVHASLAFQLRFLERNLELDVGGNHLIKNAKALVWGGSYFAGDEARRWSRRGRELLEHALDEQILDDGMHYERSPAYHLQVFADLLECATIAGDLRASAKLSAMAQVVADTTHPDGAPSLFNDGGLHMTYAPSECLAAYTKLAGKAVRAREVFELSAAGYFGARFNEGFVLADCGAIAPDHLPAHGHGDVLAFEWSLGGQRVIVDAGVLEYEQGPWRERARATSSHNTVTLDDGDQCEFWAAFRVGRRARASVHRFEPREHGFVLEGSHDGYAHLLGAPRHVRTLAVTRDSVEVDDFVDGGAGQIVRARLLLHPDARVERIGDALRVQIGATAISISSEHRLEVVDAWWCPDFGVLLPTKQVVIAYPPAPCCGSFSLRRAIATARAVDGSLLRERSLSS